MNTKNLIINKTRQVLTVTLNRPEVRNAFNAELIAELTQVFDHDVLQEDVRLIVLKGRGEVFCAGGDLHWMKKSATYSREQNIADALLLGNLLEKMNTVPKPLVGVVHGAAMGGGLGLVSVCDYVLATKDCVFSFSEARLGLIPAVIGPFVIKKIGESWARALFLSTEKFTGFKAFHAGLVHNWVENEAELVSETEKLVATMLQASPHALRVAKEFIRNTQSKTRGESHMDAARTLADLRASDEGKEGIQAFLDKRKPHW